jgi:hypothetical protein
MDGAAAGSYSRLGASARGGHKQRAAFRERVEQAQTPPVAKSQLFWFLVELWSWGLMSASMVQRICFKAYQDGLSHHEIKAGAALGSEGRHPGNIRAELLRLVGRSAPDRPVVAKADIPVRIRRGTSFGLKITQQAFMLPHQMINTVYTNFQRAWRERILGPDGAQSSYWDNLNPLDPRRRECGVFNKPDYRRWAIPLAFHADGVPTTKKDSLDVYAVHSLLGQGSSLELKLLMAAIFKALMSSDATHDSRSALWKVLSWQIRILDSGSYPYADWEGRPYTPEMLEYNLRGQPFAGGYYFPIMEVKGDWEFLCNQLSLEHWNSAQPCPLCRCDRGLARGVFNFTAEAEWKGTLYKSSAEWSACHEDRHPIFRLPNVNIFSVIVDVLHCVDLGVTAHVVGNALYYMATTDMLPCAGGLEQKTQYIWNCIQAFYAAHGRDWTKAGINRLTPGMFTKEKGHTNTFPSLRGMKAAESRQLVEPVMYVFETHYRRDVHPEGHILLAIKNLWRFYTLTDKAHGRYLPARRVLDCKQSVDELLLHYNACNDWAVRSAKHMFNFTPKFHLPEA